MYLYLIPLNGEPNIIFKHIGIIFDHNLHHHQSCEMSRIWEGLLKKNFLRALP